MSAGAAVMLVGGALVGGGTASASAQRPAKAQSPAKVQGATSAARVAATDPPAPVAVLYVATTGSDASNNCQSPGTPCATISHAVSQAEGLPSGTDATIYVGPGTYHEKVAISDTTNPTLAVVGSPGATTVDAQGNGTVFTLNSGTVTLTALSITGGSASDSGGGVSIASGTATLNDDAIVNNSAPTVGGGVFNNAGSTATLVNDSIANNSAVNGGGGGIYNGGTATVTNVTIANNSGPGGGGAFLGHGTATLTNDTIANNSASDNSGGVEIGAGSANLTNDTIANNSSVNNGGGATNFGATATLTNTILAANSAPAGKNCAGTPFADGGHNVEDATTCGFPTTNGSLSNQPDSAIGLGALTYNGGYGDTEAIGNSSAAHDLVPAPKCSPTDERGVVRPEATLDPACDAGAFEVLPAPLTPSIALTATPGSSPAGPVTTLAATLSPGAPVGTVQFSRGDGQKLGGPQPLVYDPSSGADTATLIVASSSIPAPGNKIIATYSGNFATFNGASTSISTPGAPTNVHATAGNASATVTFSPPASDGGSPVTSYTATATDHTNPSHGGQTASAAGSPITVSGLTNGDSYTFTVRATNAVGTGPASAPSNAVTPAGPAQPVVSSPQFGVPNQTDVFDVAPSGAVEVRWVQGGGHWNGPLTISPPKLAGTGAHLAVSQQFGLPNRTDVFVVGTNGAVQVLWVDGAGSWKGPLAISATGQAPTGAHLAASQQFGVPNQTDVFVVGNDGSVQVLWAQAGGAWHGPLAISAKGFADAPGEGLAASNQFGIPSQTDVFLVGFDGSTQVLWVHGAGAWNGPLAISPKGLFHLSDVAASTQFGLPNQTDVFVVGDDGATNVLWVQGAGKWKGPLAISPTGFAPPGAGLAASQQFGVANQTDVFVVGRNGAVEILEVQGGGAWHGPTAISPTGFAPAGAGLAASQQFGVPNQTDVFVVGDAGTAEVLWIQGSGKWNGPLAI